MAAALAEVQQLHYRAATAAAAPGFTVVPPPDSAVASAARAADLYGDSSPVFGPALKGATRSAQPLLARLLLDSKGSGTKAPPTLLTLGFHTNTVTMLAAAGSVLYKWLHDGTNMC